MAIVDINYINASLTDPFEKAVWAQYLQTDDSVTAKAGGGQATAYPINFMTTRVTTVASAADSLRLPPSSGGLFLTVANAAGVNAMNVFPAAGESINALGANTAFSIAAGKACFFVATSKGQWHTVLSA
jgi:hypothetical protein